MFESWFKKILKLGLHITLNVVSQSDSFKSDSTGLVYTETKWLENRVVISLSLVTIEPHKNKLAGNLLQPFNLFTNDQKYRRLRARSILFFPRRLYKMIEITLYTPTNIIIYCGNLHSPRDSILVLYAELDIRMLLVVLLDLLETCCRCCLCRGVLSDETATFFGSNPLLRSTFRTSFLELSLTMVGSEVMLSFPSLRRVRLLTLMRLNRAINCFMLCR